MAAIPSPFLNLLTVKQSLLIQPMTRPGFLADSIRGDYALKDPFIMADHYRMSQPVFGPHPHAGFSAVTYMFDDAQTGFDNRDSLGDKSVISAGDAHWTVAGAGVVHDEVPQVHGKVAHGLQMFINLAAKDKHMPAKAIHISNEQMPRLVQSSGAKVKLVFGSYQDDAYQIAPVKPLPTEVILLDVEIQPGEAFKYMVPLGINAFVVSIQGSILIANIPVKEGQAVALGREGGALIVTSATKAQFVLFMGRPLDEPLVQHGPFAMTNQADIERAISDYQAGRMGTLS
jgi:redox-sensitive bicupin YhaK (pirin superfamily)